MILTNTQYEVYLNPNNIKACNINKSCTEAFKYALSEFNEIWPRIRNFIIDGQVTYKDIKITALSIEEDMYLKSLLDLPIETKEIKNVNGYIIGKIRFFTVEDLNRDYQILTFNRDNIRLISVFLGNQFYDEDNYNIIKFMYDLAEILIETKLYGFCNIESSVYCTSSPNNIIVLNDIITPSDVKFIIQYYYTLFNCITSNSACDYNYIYENCARPIIPIIKGELLSEIMDITTKIELEDVSENNEYTNLLYNKIYNHLNEFVKE